MKSTHKHLRRHVACAALAAIVCTLPSVAVAQTYGEPYEQHFTLTAYYSPLPDQCCYVKGSYEADKILNGEGTHAADGTPVYEGMLAAPPSYAFGTRISLRGLGVLTVHDRGGAIQEQDGTHRLDVWAGSGEEGLARALAFGVQRMKGIVYPVGSDMPEKTALISDLPAPLERLEPYATAGTDLTDMRPAHGDRGLSVRLMQEALAALGHFDHDITGLYGDVTKNALAEFLRDVNLEEPSDELTEKAAAWLQAAVETKDAPSPIDFINEGSSASDIKTAQRALRHLGHYRGRTDGKYSDALVAAIVTYQKEKMLVADRSSPGAGKIGPLTKGELDKSLMRERIARTADKILTLARIRDRLAERDALLDSTMQTGRNGRSVTVLQTFLARKGFFPADKINGNFGPLTEESLARYQVAKGLLSSRSDKGAGTVGPITLRTVRDEQVMQAYRLMREKGTDAI